MSKLRTGALARRIQSSERFVRQISDLGLIPYERDSSNSRLFEEAVVSAARAIYEERLAKCSSRERIARNKKAFPLSIESKQNYET